jgi:hypothetical protein
LQHARATAVEVAGAFRGEALKSSHGSEAWLRFFQLMGSEIARTEGCPLVDGTPTDSVALIGELRECATELRVDQLLTGWTRSIEPIQETGSVVRARYHVLELDTTSRQLRITGFPRTQLTLAQKERLRLEAVNANNPNVDVVLVSANSIEEITKGYPNYRLDTSAFIEELRGAIGNDDDDYDDMREW